MPAALIQLEFNFAAGQRPWMAAGFVASVLLHAFVALTIVGGFGLDRASPLAAAASLTQDQHQSRPVLGLTTSRQVSISWLGFADNPTEHQADQAPLDQAALARATAGGTGQPAQAAIADPSPPLPDPLPSVVDAFEPLAIAPAPSLTAADRAGPLSAAEPVEAADRIDPLTGLGEAAKLDPVEPVTVPPTSPNASPKTKPATPGTGPARGSAEDAAPGDPSDRDSPATSIEQALVLNKWGRPLAGEGLEIRTVRPRFPLHLSYTQWPKNPLVRIEFAADGTVRRAIFVRDLKKKIVHDTGSDEVNRPLLQAVYRWTAVGKRIDALDPEKPSESVTVVIRIVLTN